VEKGVKISSSNVAVKTKKKPAPTDPAWRKWKVEITSDDNQPLSTIVDHVEYILHESFETPRIGTPQKNSNFDLVNVRLLMTNCVVVHHCSAYKRTLHPTGKGMGRV